MQRLKYEKFNNSNDVIIIDLHNGYTVIAITGFNAENKVYTTTLFLKENTIDRWELIEMADKIEFRANQNTINSAVLKQVSTFLDEGFFNYYINRYEDYESCINTNIDSIGEDIGNRSASWYRL